MTCCVAAGLLVHTNREIALPAALWSWRSLERFSLGTVYRSTQKCAIIIPQRCRKGHCGEGVLCEQLRLLCAFLVGLFGWTIERSLEPRVPRKRIREPSAFNTLADGKIGASPPPPGAWTARAPCGHKPAWSNDATGQTPGHAAHHRRVRLGDPQSSGLVVHLRTSLGGSTLLTSQGPTECTAGDWAPLGQ